MFSHLVMQRVVSEVIAMRLGAPHGSVGRRLAERCLELCLQEMAANDEDFAPLPLSALQDLLDTVVDGPDPGDARPHAQGARRPRSAPA